MLLKVTTNIEFDSNFYYWNYIVSKIFLFEFLKIAQITVV